MSLTNVGALVLRYLYLYARNPIRMIELFFWPLVQLLVWGYLTTFLQQNTTSDFPHQITYLIGAVILWDILFRAQQGVSIFFLEDVWSRNLLNIFAAPVTNADYLCSTYVVGLLRASVTAAMLSGLALLIYSFNIFTLSWGLVPLVINLLIFGWGLGMISTSLIVRWGPAAESLAWAVPFFIQPFAAVFYPVSALPDWLEPLSGLLPCTHVFEGMREGLTTGSVPVGHLLWATGLNFVYLAIAGILFVRVMNTAREKGLLTKFSSQ